MTTVAVSHTGGGGGRIVLFFLLLMVVLALAVMTAVGPLTKHAGTSHAEQTWNAITISEYMDSGKCVPQAYVCINQEIRIEYCELKPGLSIGRITGLVVRQVMTGFAARTKYWENRCK